MAPMKLIPFLILTGAVAETVGVDSGVMSPVDFSNIIQGGALTLVAFVLWRLFAYEMPAWRTELNNDRQQHSKDFERLSNQIHEANEAMVDKMDEYVKALKTVRVCPLHEYEVPKD